MRFLLLSLLSCSLLCPSSTLNAQTDTLDRKAAQRIAWVGGATYALGMTGLYQLWYKEGSRSHFQWFDDRQEWLQLDKTGHVYTSFHLSSATSDALKAHGMPADKARMWGALSSWAVVSSIEVFDGFSPDYGASWSDLLANAGGSLLFVVQDLPNVPLQLSPKFSFHRSPYASLRPNTLGDKLSEQVLKDYNGQTYWLSLGLKEPKKRYLRWLNLAIGYGGEQMVYGHSEENLTAGYNSYRQWFLAPDISFRHVRARRGWQKVALRLIDLIHLPLPAVEYSRGRIQLHAIYF